MSFQCYLEPSLSFQLLLDDDWFYHTLYPYPKVLIKTNAHKNVKNMVWFKKSFLVSTGHVKRKKDLARFCVLHTAGLKVVLLGEDILPVLNINLLKCGWSGSLTILLKWLSPKLKIKSHRVGKHSKESLSFIDYKWLTVMLYIDEYTTDLFDKTTSFIAKIRR